MFQNQGPCVIRHPSRGGFTPASRARARPASSPARDVVSFCARRNFGGSLLWSGEQTAWKTALRDSVPGGKSTVAR